MKARSGFQRLSKIMAAASVSLRGASPVFSRYPLLCNPAPLVSIDIVAISFNKAAWILNRGPFSGNQLRLYLVFIFSTMAFLTMAWQSETLNNLDFIDFPSTGNSASSGISSSQGRALVPSNSSSKVKAGNWPAFINSRSAVRSHILQRGIARTSPVKDTLPFSTVKSLYPSCLSSRASTASNPKALVAISSILSILLHLFRSIFCISTISSCLLIILPE